MLYTLPARLCARDSTFSFFCRCCCCVAPFSSQAALEEARDAERSARAGASAAKALAHEADEARLAAEDEHLTARVAIKQLQVNCGR